MNRIIYLARHGRPRLPDDRKRFVGRTDLPLSEKGIRQAEEMGCHFEEVLLSAIYTSDLARSVETARIACRNLDLDRLPLHALRELDLGEWEMRPLEEVASEEPEAFAARGEDLEGFRPPGGESFDDLAQRVIPAFESIRNSTKGNFLIIGHAGVFRILLCHLLKISLKQSFLIAQNYCGIHVLHERKDSVRMLHSNWTPEL